MPPSSVSEKNACCLVRSRASSFLVCPYSVFPFWGVSRTPGGCRRDGGAVSCGHPVRATSALLPTVLAASRRPGSHCRFEDRHPFHCHPAPVASASSPLLGALLENRSPYIVKASGPSTRVPLSYF